METYKINVDYTRPLKDLIAACKFQVTDWIDLPADDNYKIYGNAPVQRKIELMEIDKELSTDDVMNRMEVTKVRPATIEEFLTFISQYPELQEKFPLVCLGYLRNFVTIGYGVPFAYVNRAEDEGYDPGRTFDLIGVEDLMWQPEVKFLVVPRE